MKNNNKGFTMIEILFAMGFLAMSMSATQMTLDTLNKMNVLNDLKYKEVFEYTSEFEGYVSGVSSLADLTSLTNPDVTVYTATCYTTFDSLTTDNAYDSAQWRFYYKTGLVPGADDYTYNPYSRNIHTFVKRGTESSLAYYFVVS